MCSSLSKNKRKRSANNGLMQPQKIQRIMSSLPDRMLVQKYKQSANTVTLHDFVMSMVSAKGVNVKVQTFDKIEDFFCDPTQKEIEAYQQDVLMAVRERDLNTLRLFHQQGRPLKCSNRFGESLLHLACRKGMVDVVEFLVAEAGVPLSIRDDYGRSPLHDACWTPSPNFDLIDLILSHCPDLLYISDQRGHTPLSYVRQENWGAWKKFLSGKVNLLLPKQIV